MTWLGWSCDHMVFLLKKIVISKTIVLKPWEIEIENVKTKEVIWRKIVEGVKLWPKKKMQFKRKVYPPSWHYYKAYFFLLFISKILNHYWKQLIIANLFIVVNFHTMRTKNNKKMKCFVTNALSFQQNIKKMKKFFKFWRNVITFGLPSQVFI